MFNTLKADVTRRFDKMTKGHVLAIDVDRDAVWAAYLETFPEAERQEHQCSACKAFVRQAGNAVSIDPNTLELSTVWDGDAEGPYAAPVRALRDYVRSRSIGGLWSHPNASVGVDRNADPKKPGVVWTHFHARVPKALKQTDATAACSGELRDSAAVIKRSMEELTRDSVDTVLELIAQNSLYRGVEYKPQLAFLKGAMSRWDATEPRLRDNLCWHLALTTAPALARARNTAVGTMLVALSEGTDLEAAVSAFERLVAPTNYKRPTSLVTPRMVEQAKARVSELGLLGALERKRLDARDIPAAAALFVHRPKPAANDVFAELAGAPPPADLKSLSKVEEVAAKDFVEKVLPGAKALRVLFEREHLGNLVTLTGPQDPSAPPLFKWDNGFGWSYTGGLADSVKERVKAAGGSVDGWMRVSLSWHNFDDLDLHMTGPGGQHVYFSNKFSPAMGARLDVDMNAGGGSTREPVENIHVSRQLNPGPYSVYVNNFCSRESSNVGYEVEIECNGELRHFGAPTSPRGQTNGPIISFTVAADGRVTFADNPLAKSASGPVKWGLKTGSWHRAKAVSTSPNHWTRPTGNKHLFFLLEGCVSDERTRPFYNEFLREELAKERKVTEVLGSKLEVAPADGAELSGLGFSETARNHVFVEVEGAFKRTVKVVF